MCEDCLRRDERPDDAMKLHDVDMKALENREAFVHDMLSKAYLALKKNPEDQPARDIFTICGPILFGWHPIRLYQTVRDEHESTSDLLDKVLGNGKH